MPIVTIWDKSFSVGSQLLDRQHQKIIHLSNLLADSLSNLELEDKADFHQVLNELAEYSRDHFVTEEALLLRYEYPDLEVQQSDHMEYCRVVAELSFAAATVGVTDKIILQQFISKWWTAHILGSDMEFRDFLISRSAP
jgi:hemerythrin-like metal-binding protein